MAEDKETEIKKHHPVRKILLVLLIIFLVLFFMLAGWIIYSSLERKDTMSVLPSDFTLYLRSDRLWSAANPIVDVKALDVFLADPAYGEVRSAVMGFRSSEIRKNKWLAFAANRRVDAAFYNDGTLAAAVDMGPLSSVTRIASKAYSFIKVPNLSYVSSDGKTWFEYAAGKTIIYAKPYHNFLLIATSKKLLLKMAAADNLKDYTPDRKNIFTAKLKNPFRIVCDVSKVLAFNETVKKSVSPIVMPLLIENPYAYIDFGITDSDMHMQLTFPLATLTPETIDSFEAGKKLPPAILSIAAGNSDKSILLGRLGDTVQYYTMINIAPLAQLKDAAVPLVPKQKNIEGLWATGESVCKMLFSISLEDLLFSWTGKEMAVLGLEGKKDPVFVIQVSDEAKRKDVFDKVFSSFLINENNSLILNGMRVPQMKLPDFLQNVLEAFGIKIAKPYYFVNDGYVYFSESAENIVQIANQDAKTLLEQNDNFKSASTLQKKELSLSIFYNLARSIPFFLDSKSSFAKALQTYNIGRADVRIERDGKGEGNLLVLLQAISREEKGHTSVPGYPLSLDGTHNTQLCRTMSRKPQLLFWVQDDTKIQMYSADSSASASFDVDDKVQIVPASEDTKNGVLWAVSGSGVVYLFTKELKVAEGYPVALNSSCTTKPTLFEDALLVPSDDGVFHYVLSDGTVKEEKFSFSGKIKSTPSTQGSTIAFYSKSLAGSLLVATNVGKPDEAVNTTQISNIAFGSPAIIVSDDATTIAFITQNGLLSLYDKNAVPLSTKPISFDKVYYTNAVTNGTYFYILSSDGVMSRISTTGEILSIQIPNCSAKSPTVVTEDYDGDGVKEIFVNGDSNLIYGFTENLELIAKFPVAGIEVPVFADLDGDNKQECMTISLDNKLNAYKLRGK